MVDILFLVNEIDVIITEKSAQEEDNDLDYLYNGYYKNRKGSCHPSYNNAIVNVLKPKARRVIRLSYLFYNAISCKQGT